MGISSSTKKTTSNQTQSGTTTPNAPAFVTQGLQDYLGRVGSFAQTDPNSYVAGASPLQQQAWSNADRLGDWRPQAATASSMAYDVGNRGANLAGPFAGAAVSDPRGNPRGTGTSMATYAKGAPPTTGGEFQTQGNPKTLPAHPGELPTFTGQGYTPAPDIPGYAQPRTGTAFNPALTGASQAGAYSDPYQQQVIDTTLADFDQNAGMTRASQQAAAAQSGAFGGSRNAITQSLTEGELARARASTDANIRSQGFQLANNFGMQDAAMGNQMYQFNAGQQDNADNRALAASALLGQQADNIGAGTRADLETLSSLGGDQRDVEQAQVSAPLQQLLLEGQLLGMTPYQALVGQTINSTSSGTNVEKSTPSLFQTLMGLGQTAASAYSAGMF